MRGSVTIKPFTMAIQSYLENLRGKPEHVRKRYAFWSSLGITAIIAAFWVGSFSLTHTPPQRAVTAALEKAGSPGSSMIAGVGNFFADIKEMIFGTKKISYKEVVVKPGKK